MNRRKNKLISLLMVGCIFTSILTGCGSSTEKDASDKVEGNNTITSSNEKLFRVVSSALWRWGNFI